MAENLQEKVEDKIIDLIALGAGGRLVVFKPEKSLGHSPSAVAGQARPMGEADKDLVVEKKGDYNGKVIYLNVYRRELSDNKDLGKEIYQLILGKNNPKIDNNFYLLFVYFDIVKQEINDDFFIIPSLNMQNIAGKEDFSTFLVSKKGFVDFLIEELLKK
jgi:hypothetical protein